MPAAKGDVAELHGLVRALAEYEKLAEACVSQEADLSRALFGTPRAAEALIVRKSDESRQAIGFALFFHTYSTFTGRPSLWLEDLFVRPEARGNGIGQALLRALAGIAVERGCARFDWAVLDWNAPAIRFYRSLGATVLPDWRIARVAGDDLTRLANEK